MRRQLVPLAIILGVLVALVVVPRRSFGRLGGALKALDAWYDRVDGVGDAPCQPRGLRRYEGPAGTEFVVPGCWATSIQPGGLHMFSDRSLKLGVVTVIGKPVQTAVLALGPWRAEKSSYSSRNTRRAQQYFAWTLTNGRLEVRVFYVVPKDLLQHPALPGELEAVERLARSVREVSEAAVR